MRWGKIVCAALVASAFAASPASAQKIEIGHIPKCTEGVPAVVATAGAATIVLDVRVLLDGVTLAQAQSVVSQAQQSYTPLKIALNASYQSVGFSGTETTNLMNQAKALFGGARPAGTDFVYVLTSKDVTSGGNAAVAGQADCIGGVAFADRAFGVGELWNPDDISILGRTLSGQVSAKILAHEGGHLLGAHHHYANCAEGVQLSLTAELSPCTLMFNDIALQSLNFSTLNTPVVRGHAVAYAG